MRITRKEVGYLINFGRKGELQWKRFVLFDLHGKEKKGENESPLITTNHLNRVERADPH